MAEGYAAYSRIHGTRQLLLKSSHHVDIIGEDDGPYFETTFLNRLKRYFKINASAIRQMRHYDAVIARGHFAHLPWVWFAARRGKTVIYEMNGFVSDAMTTYSMLKIVQPLIRLFYRMQFKRSALILCVSEEIAGHVRLMGNYPNVATVSNGADSALFWPTPSDEAEDYAIFPSSLAPWHGVQSLLDAVAHPAWPPDLKLAIAGDGIQTPMVRERAAKDSRIRYLGRLDRLALAEKLRRARIGLCLVQPIGSRGVTEVYPLKLFEMMASGLPVIATDMPGQRDVVTKAKAGVIVPVGEPASIASAVRALHENPERRAMGLAGAAAVREHFDWRSESAVMDRHLREAITRNGQDRARS
jgi:glycosyltransferase involved in cell wall biosynthesis